VENRAVQLKAFFKENIPNFEKYFKNLLFVNVYPRSTIKFSSFSAARRNG
jgi:hypothetical protein